MKLATLRDGSRDGRLVVVRRDNAVYAPADRVAPSLQAALDDWERAEPRLRELAADLEAGTVESFPVEPERLHAPLPRAYEWVDGSAYLNHVILVRKARGAEPPPSLREDPLVYQGGSGHFLGPTEDIPLPDPEWGLDFESEVAVVLGDTPRGTKAAEASRHVRLLLLVNDVTLRNLIPGELAKGFGFFQSKPATAFGPLAVTADELGDAWRDGRAHLPLRTTYNGQGVGEIDAGAVRPVRLLLLVTAVTRRTLIPGELAPGFGFFQSRPATAFGPFAVTPDELGGAWRDGRVHLPLRTTYNGQVVGEIDAGAEMHFSFFDLVEHICKTRSFTAGTILGGGTVSTEDRTRGISCLAERRMIEIIETGAPKTPFMSVGDTVEIEMFDREGRSVFGRIRQRVVRG